MRPMRSTLWRRVARNTKLAVALFASIISDAHGASDLEINACELLTVNEISTVIGMPVVDGRRQDEGIEPDGQYSSSCIWMIAPGKGGRRFVILNVQRWPAGRDLSKKFLQAFRDSADQGVIASRPTPRNFGDEALWWGDGLAVRRGDISFGLSVFIPNPNAPRTSTMEEKLAPYVLKRVSESLAKR